MTRLLALVDALLAPLSGPSRRALRPRLVQLFRTAMLEPAAGFGYLLLLLLDVERLRGELVARAAFAQADLDRP